MKVKEPRRTRCTMRNWTTMRIIVRVLMMLAVALCLIQLGSSQATMSTGWGPGKRSSYDSKNCMLTARSAVTACHVFMNEVKQLAACEARSIVRYMQAEEDPMSNRMLFTGR